MLFRIIRAILGSAPEDEKPSKRPLTQKEKDKREYELWVRAEEYEEE